MPDEAVMDTAVDETPLDTGTDGADAIEPEGGEPEQQQDPQITAPAKALIEGGKLSAEAKQTLEEMKATNPALAKAVTRALFKEAEWQKEVPGGIKEVRALRATVEELGGEHGITEMRSEMNGFRQFDEQYTAGDPKAIEFMTSDPQGQEAFLKLIPAAMQKYEQLHPAGFQNYMAQVMDGTMQNAGIPLALERLGDLVADNPRALEYLNQIRGTMKWINDTARKQPEAPKIQQAAPDTRASDLETRENALTRNEWKNETAGEQKAVFQSEWDRLSAGRKVGDTVKAAIYELFESRLNKAINQKHAETLNRYFAAKDKAGFLRYASSISKTEVPKALREAFDAVMPARPGTKPGTAVIPKNGTPQNGKAQAPAKGFITIAKQPGSGEIDYRNPYNTPANFMKGQAILTDGRRVQWTRQ